MYFLTYLIGKDDYVDEVTGWLGSKKPTLSHRGIEICVQAGIPDHQQVKVGVKFYEASKPEFSFPEDFSTKGYVCTYRIKVAATHIRGIQVTFPLPQKRDSVCVLEASGNPSRWRENLIPGYSFSQIKATYHDGAVKVTLRSSTCYLVAGE